MPPTVENLIVLTWLRLIKPSLPQLVKQRYGTELRARTLASIKPLNIPGPPFSSRGNLYQRGQKIFPHLCSASLIPGSLDKRPP